MTLDERIQALTESVELLSSMHRDFETRMEKIATLMSDNLTVLTSIVASHERRITGLEHPAESK